MNYWFIFAAVWIFMSFGVHMIAGDKEYRRLNPRKQSGFGNEKFGYWLMGRGTFQMVSVDLLLTSAALFLLGIDVIPYNRYLALFIALLYGGYLISWLLTLYFSKAKQENYIKQPQWIIFLVALVLILLGLK